ncbi:MAG: cupredoxin domain-containing protein [Deltaproteobacteria bacterium]|nr:cupredoxin domain-containing protein [Deltaproteobacteria bacterium]
MRKGFCAVLAVLLTGSCACAAETAEVVIQDYSFTPSTVVIKPGDTVKWLNKVDNQHTATSGKDGKADGTWDSKRLNNGQSFSYTFEKAGTYPYFCVPHTVFKMQGVVEVKE